MKKLAMGFFAAFLVAAPAAAQQTTLKLGADTVSAGALWVKTLKPWAEKVMADSGGALKIELYPDGQITKIGDTFDRVTSGVADIAWDLPLVYGRRFQSMTVLGVPGLYDSAPDAATALWRMFQKGQVGKELADVKMLAFFVNPNVSVFAKKPITDPGSLKGVKISVGSKLRGDIVQNLGGVPVSLRVPELYQSMSKGVVDGSMTNYAVIKGMRLDEQVTWFLDGPMGGAVATLYMSKKAYDALPPAAKAAIDRNSGEATSKWASEVAVQDEKEILNGLLKIPGAKHVKLEGASLAAWMKAFDPVVAEWVKSTPGGQEMVNQFLAEIKKK